MANAVQSLSYEGTVVRISNGEAESLKVAHTIVDGVVRERVVAQLEQGGSRLYVKLLPGVTGMFYEEDDSEATRRVLQTIPADIATAVGLLARHEVLVANYYIRRKAYVAAASRAKYVLEHYERAPAAADALVAMVVSYRALGMDDLAADSLRVLQLNFPDHAFLNDTRRDWERGILDD